MKIKRNIYIWDEIYIVLVIHTGKIIPILLKIITTQDTKEEFELEVYFIMEKSFKTIHFAHTFQLHLNILFVEYENNWTFLLN